MGGGGGGGDEYFFANDGKKSLGKSADNLFEILVVVGS